MTEDKPLLALTRPGASASDRAGAQNMRQLVQLRWLAVAGQLATILFVHLRLGVPLPLAPMLGVLALSVLVNLASLTLLRRRAVGRRQLLVALLFDVGALTVQLYLSGGAANPFAYLFLLHVVLAAILLDLWATWTVVAVTVAGFAGLALVARPLRFPARLSEQVAALNTAGRWACFALVAVLLVLFITRISRNLRLRDRRLADLRQQAAEEDHVVRMGLLASGAAHELGTPLASLAVVLNDWRRVPAVAADPELMAEVAEMQAEVARCKAIVSGVLRSAGEPRGEAPEVTGLHAFLDRLVGEWRRQHPGVPLDYRRGLDDDRRVVADPSLRQAIGNLLDNAAEASPDAVEVRVRCDGDELAVAVRDRGPGLPPALLRDFGRPYVSTKGEGHGVGLFLAANVARKLGGRLRGANRPDGGAELVLSLSLATIGV